MNTEQVYYDEPYATEADVEITSISSRNGGMVALELNKTIFYPEGGGQPTDQGELVTGTGSVKISNVRNQNGAIVHEGKMTGTVEEGQSATASVKWPRRHKYMRIHSAGHLLHDVLVGMRPDLKAIRGKHGDKAFLEYEGELDPNQLEELQSKVNEAVAADLPIKTWECSYDELAEMCKTLPPNLPKDKQLRVLQIGHFEAMPDGGVQVKSTSEIGRVVIHHITNENGHTVIRYGVANT
ncbi:MAG: alanine--tRNA ligase-related protein [Arthrospira platensis]